MAPIDSRDTTSSRFTWDDTSIRADSTTTRRFDESTPGVRAGDSEQIRDRQGNLWIKDKPLVSARSIEYAPIYKKGIIGISVSSGVQYISGPRGYWFRMDCPDGRKLYEHYVENPMKRDKRKFELETRVKLNKISPENEPKNIFHFLEACKVGLVEPGLTLKEKEEKELEDELPF